MRHKKRRHHKNCKHRSPEKHHHSKSVSPKKDKIEPEGPPEPPIEELKEGGELEDSPDSDQE